MALVGSWVEKTLLCWSLMGCPSMTKLTLRVVAQGMEETVAIGRHAAGAVRDGLAQAAAGIDRGELHDQVPVGIDVRGGIDLEEIRPRPRL